MAWPCASTRCARWACQGRHAAGTRNFAAIARACGPLMRTIPRPARPGGVEMATMVSASCIMWGRQSCLQPAFSRLDTLESVSAAWIGCPTSALGPLDGDGVEADFLLGAVSRVAGHLGDLLDDIVAFGDLAEDAVVIVQVRGGGDSDEELAAIGAGSGVGHR